MYKALPHLRHKEERAERVEEPEDQGICCGVVSPTNAISYTHNISPTRMAERELNKNDTRRHDKASTLHRELQASEERLEWKNVPS